MGRYKCAYNCESSSESDVKFFKFPLYNPRKLKKWLNNMKWEDWTPSRFSVLCINHFEDQYIDRTGKSVTLKDNAIPTIFSSSNTTKKEKTSGNSRSKQNKTPAAKTTQMISTESQTTTSSITNPSEESSLTGEIPGDNTEQNEADRWRIIVDEGLMKIESFPHFFHGDYCVPQRDIQWAPDDDLSVKPPNPENVIEVTEPWQWLGLDVRGPLPETLNGHKYMLTLTDYYSKWVEALPMDALLPEQVAKHITEIIAHFGFPLRILSRLPHDMVQKINNELKEQLKVTFSLVVHHQQTGSADLITEQLIDSMVTDLIEEHTPDWDVYLPAKVFSLCFTEHSQTKERPFSVLCCKEAEPVQSPRALDFADSKIQERAFVVRPISCNCVGAAARRRAQVLQVCLSAVISQLSLCSGGVFFSVSNQPQEMDVFLMIRRHKTTIFTDAKESTTVYELKRIVEGILKRPPEDQRLYKDDVMLNDQQTLGNCGFTNQTARPQAPATVGLAFRLSDDSFEQLRIEPFSTPPELPDVMKPQDSGSTANEQAVQ